MLQEVLVQGISESFTFGEEKQFHVKKRTQRAGVEPARGDPIGFQVQRLNHSAIAAYEEVNAR